MDHLDTDGNSMDGSIALGERRYRLVRHSVESEVQDGSISALYPIHDNYVTVGNYRRSPKSLKDLCIDVVCRSLPDFDGALPAGLPQEIVDDIVKSLISHSALNSTTLKALKNCEIGELSLAGCRGVRDEWFKPLSVRPCLPYSPQVPALCRASFDQADQTMSPLHLDCDGSPLYDSSFAQSAENLPLVPKFTSEIDDEDGSESSSGSSTTFVSATSNPLADLAAEPNSASYSESDNLMSSPEGSFTQWKVSPDDFSFHQFDLGVASAITTNLTVLDLRGSQRLTDRGLLQLCGLRSLEVAKLDHCHSIVGKGLVAFASSERLHTLSLANCRRLTDEAIINISHLAAIEALSLDGCRCITDSSLIALSSMYELRKLDLTQCDLITDSGLNGLRRLELIEELSLGWCRFLTDKGIKTVCTQNAGRKENLRVLRLARTDLGEEGLEGLMHLSALEELDLNGCSQIASAALGDVLEKLKNLKSLDVSYCPGILKSSWQGKIDQLETLELCYSGVKDSHLSRFTHLPSLKELNLDSCGCGDWALGHLADNCVVPNLTSLDLADTNLTDAGMVHIAKFTKLNKLSLFYCNISNHGLRHLSSLTNLEVLNLDSRDISDEGLAHLVGLPNLRSLDVFSGRITHYGCIHLSRLTSLESLELCGGGISDRGCAHLSSLENLVSLNLSQNEHITNRGAAALAALSKLKCLNLSNTRVNSGALRFLSSLTQLKSLAMYGCHGIDDSESMNVLQNGLPSLKCLRLNNGSDDRELWDDYDHVAADIDLELYMMDGDEDMEDAD